MSDPIKKMINHANKYVWENLPSFSSQFISFSSPILLSCVPFQTRAARTSISSRAGIVDSSSDAAGGAWDVSLPENQSL